MQSYFPAKALFSIFMQDFSEDKCYFLRKREKALNNGSMFKWYIEKLQWKNRGDTQIFIAKSIVYFTFIQYRSFSFD